MQSENNHDEIPSWLTREYLENLLKLQYKDNSIQIKNLTIKPATGKGEHYASVMVRTKIDYISSKKNGETKTLSIIVKTTYEDEATSKSLEEYNVFDCEIMQYKKFLPTFHELLYAAGDNTKLSAESFHIDPKTKSLILNDLCVLGYRNANRVLGMDLVHAKMLISKIAKFHAASVTLQSQDKTVFKNFDKGMFNHKATSFNSFFEANLASLINQISQWGPDYQKYVTKLLKLQKVFIEKATALYDLQEGDFHVLIHGDLWLNNMMFLYKNDRPIDVLMVDFQLSSWNSPVFDLIYFLNTSLEENVRDTDKDELIQHYHETLVETLNKLEYTGKIITLHELQQKILEKLLIEFITAFLIRPIMIEDRRHIDLPVMLNPGSKEGIEYRNFLYSNETIIKTLKTILPRLDKKGLFD